MTKWHITNHDIASLKLLRNARTLSKDVQLTTLLQRINCYQMQRISATTSNAFRRKVHANHFFLMFTIDHFDILLDYYIIHYNDVIMGATASQITSLTIVYSTVYLGADQRKHQNSASLTFVLGIHRWPVNSPDKGPVTRKVFPFDYVTMCQNGGNIFGISFAGRCKNNDLRLCYVMNIRTL